MNPSKYAVPRNNGDDSLFWRVWIVLLFVSITVVIGIALAGCSKVTMSPDYARQLEISAINVGELNRRCQGGDDDACRAGLAVASETLDLLVDALHGEASEGGDPNDG